MLIEPNGVASAEVAVALLRHLGYEAKAATIRVWAHRGHVRRCGKSEDGRQLYHFGDIWKKVRDST